MKNVLLRAASISFLAAILMFDSSMIISEAAATTPAPLAHAPSQVVMFSCVGDMAGMLVVQSASSSAGAQVCLRDLVVPRHYRMCSPPDLR